MADYPDWITYLPLRRNWDMVRGNHTSRLCSIKAIAIHYVNNAGQSARSVRQFFQDSVHDIAQPKPDLNAMEQGNPIIGAHFVIDDSEILALAPNPYYAFIHVNDERNRPANRNNWGEDRTKFVRGGPSYYTVGIEHCHPDTTGKFSPVVLKKSHKLVRWLLKEYGAGLMIGRHYDFSGKACPMYYAPVLRGKNDFDNFRPEFPNEIIEVQMKSSRWSKLLSYYKQSNAESIPSELL